MKSPIRFLVLGLTCGFAVYVFFAIGEYIAPAKPRQVQLNICEAGQNGDTKSCEKLPENRND